MIRKNDGIPMKLKNVYKNLPLGERAKVLQTARRLLKTQRKKERSMLKDGKKEGVFL